MDLNGRGSLRDLVRPACRLANASRHEIPQSIDIFSVPRAVVGSLSQRAIAGAKSDTGAHSARINELSRAGKYAEAVALAQGQVESLEKKHGPAHRDVGAALNNPAQLHGSQGRDEAEPLSRRSIAILEKSAGLDSPEIASASNNLVALYQRQERITRSSAVIAIPSFCSGHGRRTQLDREKSRCCCFRHSSRRGCKRSLKRAPLADYGIVYFATHGLVAGDIKGLGEPSLALSIAKQPTEFDGLLTSSEVMQLKLNADWVVLSACNTIAGASPRNAYPAFWAPFALIGEGAAR